MIAALARNISLLVLGPILVAILAFGAASLLPKTYKSVAILNFDEASFLSAEAYIRSPAVLDLVLRQNPGLPGNTPEQQRRMLNERIQWQITPGHSRNSTRIFYLTVEDRAPARAQLLSVALLETWLDLTKPRPETKARLEQQLQRVEAQLQAAEELVQTLQAQTPSLVTPNSLQGELATSLAGLMARRDTLKETAIRIRQELTGTSRDVILSPSSLPVEPSSPRPRMFAALAAIAAGVLLTIFVLLRELIRARPGAAAKLARARQALLFGLRRSRRK